MKLQTVIDNLTNTINGKRELLDTINADYTEGANVAAQFLRINLTELDCILSDLKKVKIDQETS